MCDAAADIKDQPNNLGVQGASEEWVCVKHLPSDMVGMQDTHMHKHTLMAKS